MTAMKDRTVVRFCAYEYGENSGLSYTLFLFYTKIHMIADKSPVWMWDDDKLTIEDAVENYPPEHYNWIIMEDC